MRKFSLALAAAAAGLVMSVSAAQATTPQYVLDFVKDHGKELLTYPSKLTVLGYTLPEINNLGECYAATTVIADGVNNIPGAKTVIDQMMSCKANIDDAVLAIAAKDGKYGATFAAAIKKGEDIPEEVLETIAKDIGAEVSTVSGKIKGEMGTITKLVAGEITKEALDKAENAAKYVAAAIKAEEEAKEKEIAAEADATVKDLKTAQHEVNKVTNKTIVAVKSAGNEVKTVAKKAASALKHFFSSL